MNINWFIFGYLVIAYFMIALYLRRVIEPKGAESIGAASFLWVIFSPLLFTLFVAVFILGAALSIPVFAVSGKTLIPSLWKGLMEKW